ncbi:hypothetical protein HQ535_03240 [bacterium]|nr:hypothetical protein [bacterium]
MTVPEEVNALHGEFERLLRGEGSDDFSRIEASLASEFSFISPGGDEIDRTRLLAGLHAARGTRHIRIRIENGAVRWSADGTALATYEEWHDHGSHSTARRSTALLTVDGETPG